MYYLIGMRNSPQSIQSDYRKKAQNKYDLWCLLGNIGYYMLCHICTWEYNTSHFARVLFGPGFVRDAPPYYTGSSYPRG